ncbi:MAG: hypothetical protein WBP93_15950 [Pyrinomonadaceae bacterium]
MRKQLFITFALALSFNVARAQDKTSTTNAPRPAQTQTTQTRTGSSLDLAEYGVGIQVEPRLVVMMAALDAAGFDPTPAGKEPNTFRAQIKKDQANLDPDLRRRLHEFFERNNRQLANASPAQQASRYVSLAYVLGPPPTLEAPERSDDLPGGILEVLDFAPLVREFYQKSGMDERLKNYVRLYQAEGDQMKTRTAEMVRAVLSYLHTRPTLTTLERVRVQSPTATGKQKKNAQQATTVRERDRRFYIVPDLLAASGTINFRIIGDDYYAIAPLGTDPAASEIRRGYLQFVIDPLVLRFNKDIAARRADFKQLVDERAKTGANVSPDLFLTISRSLVAAADARMEGLQRLASLARETRAAVDATKEQAAREKILKAAQLKLAAIEDDTAAQLADAYEDGALLAFHFSDQLRDVESAGFDIANFITDMITSFDPARELKRPAEYAAARERALAARKARASQRAASDETPEETSPDAARRAALVKNLVVVDEMLRLNNYAAADAKLKALMQEYPGEARIFFALARSASISAQDAIDESVQSERLNRALANYRFAIQSASPDTDRALISRAHEAMGRIFEHFEQKDEAIKEFEAAMQTGKDVAGSAYREAEEGKKRLSQPR